MKTNTNEISIKKVDMSDISDDTQVVNIIHLSDGRELKVWNGNASYSVPDEATGVVTEGSVLTAEHQRFSYHGEPFTLYVFREETAPF